MGASSVCVFSASPFRVFLFFQIRYPQVTISSEAERHSGRREIIMALMDSTAGQNFVLAYHPHEDGRRQALPGLIIVQGIDGPV